MHLNNARYVLAVWEAGGYSAAARRLYISQSALSQAVRQVEKDIGAAIFSREGGKLHLTYAGERYAAAARDMLLLDENLRRELDEIRNETRGRLRFGIPAQQGMVLLPAVLRPFVARYPLVRIEIMEQGSVSLSKMVSERTLDIALARTVQQEPGVIYEHLQPERIGILAGEGTRLFAQYDNGTALSLRDAAEEAFIFLKPAHNARTVQERLTQQLQLSLRCMVELDTFETAKRVAVCCAGVMLAPWSILKNDPDLPGRAHFYPLRGAAGGQSTSLLYHKELYLTQYMRDWMQLIRAQYAPAAE